MAAVPGRVLRQPLAAALLKTAGTFLTFSRLSTKAWTCSPRAMIGFRWSAVEGAVFSGPPPYRPSGIVRMSQIVLAEQVFPVVIAVWSADNRMNVLAVGLIAVFSELGQVGRPLMVEFYQYHRAVDAVVKDAIRRGSSNPCEPGIGEMAFYFFHFHAGVARVHVANVQVNQVYELLALRI